MSEAARKKWNCRITRQVNVTRDSDGRKWVNDYKVLARLGAGSYGTVHHCQREFPSGTRDFALKTYDRRALAKAKMSGFQDIPSQDEALGIHSGIAEEVKAMRHNFHPNIVLLFEVIDDGEYKKLYLVMELAKGAAALLWNPKTLRFNWNASKRCSAMAIRSFLVDLLLAVRYLHRRGISHSDIKPENTLCDDKGRLVLIDFGRARRLHIEDLPEFQGLSQTGDAYTAAEEWFDWADSSISLLGDSAEGTEGVLVRDTRGTDQFLAPECVDGSAAFNPFAVDIWACGVTCFAFVYGCLPFWGSSIPQLYHDICHSTMPMPKSKLFERRGEALEGATEETQEGGGFDTHGRKDDNDQKADPPSASRPNAAGTPSDDEKCPTERDGAEEGESPSDAGQPDGQFSDAAANEKEEDGGGKLPQVSGVERKEEEVQKEPPKPSKAVNGEEKDEDEEEEEPLRGIDKLLQGMLAKQDKARWTWSDIFNSEVVKRELAWRKAHREEDYEPY